jgi:hypothetical protein
MEMPYVVGHSKEPVTRQKQLVKIHELFTRDSKIRLPGLFGGSKQYIGIFSSLYKKYGDNFYFREKIKVKVKGDSIPKTNKGDSRFHYGDIRSEFNVRHFLAPFDNKAMVEFHARINSIAKFRRLLEAFLVGHKKESKPFDVTIKELFGSTSDVYYKSLGTNNMHRISKQIHKLPARLRDKVEAFVNEKLDTLVDIMKHDIKYEDGITMLTSNNNKDTRDGTLVYIRESRLIHYSNVFKIFMHLIVQTIMMDTYMIARMLYYATKTSCIISYTGSYHTYVYADFFLRYMKAPMHGCRTVDEITGKLSEKEVKTMVQRCVHMSDNSKCDMTGVLPPATMSMYERETAVLRKPLFARKK